jgi:hypothetical protein
MVFNATFNNISVMAIAWQFVLLVEETGVPRENYRPATSHCHYFDHNYWPYTIFISVQYTLLYGSFNNRF